jgi:adenylylsulfate kinase
MLIAMAGLPGTGKSTLAAALAAALGGVVLSKDVVRAALFPLPILDYSTTQDDLVMEAIFESAVYALRADPQRVVIIDGRTFLRGYQVRDLMALRSSLNEMPILIECVCDDAVGRERLERDHALGRHPAGNRTYELYLEVKARAEPISAPHLVLDTDQLTLDACVARCLAYLRVEAYGLPLVVLKGTYSVCRLEPEAAVPPWATGSPFLAITRTDEELSIVCRQDAIPDGVRCDGGWRCLRVAGTLDFALVGVLSSLLQPLASAGISLFAVSTFDTDYLLLKDANLARAVEVLRQRGYEVQV